MIHVSLTILCHVSILAYIPCKTHVASGFAWCMSPTYFLFDGRCLLFARMLHPVQTGSSLLSNRRQAPIQTGGTSCVIGGASASCSEK